MLGRVHSSLKNEAIAVTTFRLFEETFLLVLFAITTRGLSVSESGCGYCGYGDLGGPRRCVSV
jgi:hypothetical protein